MERPVTQRTLPAKPIQFSTSERRANMDTTEPLNIESIEAQLDSGTMPEPGERVQTTRALIAEVRRLRIESSTLANSLERVYELSEDPDGNSNEIRDAISEVADEALVAAGRMLPDGATR